MALALVLLVGAALLIRTFAGLQNVNSGIDPRNILTVQTSLAGGSYSTTAKVDNFSTQAVRRIEAIPGVEAAASAIVLPIEAGVDLPFTISASRPRKATTAATNSGAVFRRTTFKFSRFRCCADVCSAKPIPETPAAWC